MIDDPNTPDPIDPEPAAPFADIQAELENIPLAEVGGAQPGAVQPQPTDVGGPEATAPASSVAVAGAQAATAPKLRLCPGCNEVREFVNGKCSNCGYALDLSNPQVDASSYPPLPVNDNFADYSSPRSPLVWVAIGLLALVLLGIAGWFAYPMLFGEKKARNATDASTDIAAATASKAQEEAATIAIKTVAVDDALKTRITSALRAGNKAWAKDGTKAYVYRYAIRETSEVGKSQSLRIVAYAGGEQAVVAAREKDQPFFAATKTLLDELNANPGVSAALEINSGLDEEDTTGDTYVVYGKDFGREHMDEIQPVIDSIENYKNSEGQYPLALDHTVVGDVRTKGNPNFTPGGYGYVPVFRTDGSGNIEMGSGSGVKHLQPAEVSGYYLVRFLSTPTEGMDFYSQADLNYYLQKISPFPYQPNGKIRNMPLTKDGKPDGVACVVKNGKLE